VAKIFDYEWSGSVNVQSRTLLLRSPCEDKEEMLLMDEALRGLHRLTQINRNEITILLHHLGGDVYTGLGLYDAIRYSTCPTKIVVYGACMSMGVCILQGGTRRVMMPHATLMLHSGSTSVEADHNLELNAEIKEGTRLDEEYEQIIRKRAGISKKKFQEMCQRKTYLTSGQALKLGLVDEIFKA